MRVSNREVRAKIEAREDFQTHSGVLYGRNVIDARIIGPLGQLSHDAMVSLDKPTTDYVVWSYSTPIAWHSVEDGWHLVDGSYGPTTIRHQGIIRRVIGS